MRDREAVQTVVAVLEDELGACREGREVVGAHPTPGAGWGRVAWGWSWWWVESFIRDPAERRRMRRTLDEVDRFTRDLRDVVALETGHAQLAAPYVRMADELKRRLVGRAFYPSAADVCSQAVGIGAEPAARAASQLLKRIEARQWQTTYW